MSRGLLSNDELKAIGDHLPDTLAFQLRTQELSPDLISMSTAHDSWIPVASICFMDLGDALCGIRHALHERLACSLYYNKHSDPPDERAAIFMEPYYLDDAALRLYAAGEYLAKAIVFMLGINDPDLEPYPERKSSLQSVVGEYLLKKRPREKVTDAVSSLRDSEAWRAAIRYRNELVHDQPPTIEGLGTQYQRRLRWKASEDGRGRTLALGGGDPPQCKIGDIGKFVSEAVVQLLSASRVCLDYYFHVLKTFGVSHLNGQSGIQVNLP